MANVYDWQLDPNSGQWINTADGPPPVLPQLPQTWSAPDRVSNGINAPSPSQLRGAPSGSGMGGYPAAGITPPGTPPGTSLSGVSGQAQPPDTGGFDLSSFINRFNPISSANAAELSPSVTGSSVGVNKQPYGPQYQPPNAVAGAFNNINSGSAAALAAAHRLAHNMYGWGQQASDAGAIEGGNPNVALPVSSGRNPAPTSPQPDRPSVVTPPNQWQAPPPPPPPSRVNLGYGVPGVRPAAQPQIPGPISAFTTVPRPNADPGTGGGMLGGVSGPANIGSGYGGARGGGGAPLGTALDLSHMFGGGQQPAAPAAAAAAAPVQIPRQAPAPAYRAQVPRPVARPIAPQPSVAARAAPGYSQAAGSGGFDVAQPLGPPQPAPRVSPRFSRSTATNPIAGNPYSVTGAGI